MPFKEEGGSQSADRSIREGVDERMLYGNLALSVKVWGNSVFQYRGNIPCHLQIASSYNSLSMTLHQNSRHGERPLRY